MCKYTELKYLCIMKKILLSLIILFLNSQSKRNFSDNIERTSFVRILEEVHLIEAEYQLTKINIKEKSGNKLIDDYTKLYSKFEKNYGQSHELLLQSFHILFDYMRKF